MIWTILSLTVLQLPDPFTPGGFLLLLPLDSVTDDGPADHQRQDDGRSDQVVPVEPPGQKGQGAEVLG
jgi:hypothetical protein